MSTATPTPSLAVLDTMTRIIMAQTEMTEEETRAALERTNYDLKRVIREYMCPPSSVTGTAATATPVQSTNQLRFSEIRNFMDKSAEDYYRRQEYAKIYNQVLERKKAEAEAAAVAAGAAGAAAEAETSKL
ncbi:MAG: hypothetical protein EBU66_12790 [Bacteroidetes bacterium]|nr:hypothetical protein [bacterium]NBP65522.1 hypothetical protein [Bacteroidota bacterium]